MIEAKLAVLRAEVSRETGQVMLLIETDCGFRPVMGWPNRATFSEFTRTLTSISQQMSKDENVLSGF